MGRVIKEKMLERYEAYLKSEEKSKSTIKKYLCDLRKLVDRGWEIQRKKQ